MKQPFLSFIVLSFALGFSAAARAEFDGRKLDESLAEIAKSIPVVSMPLEPPKIFITRVTRKGSFVARTEQAACPTIDFREKLGEVRNQDGLGWCFAAVGADLLSAEMGMRISDFDLALRTFAKYGPKLGEKDSISLLNKGSLAKTVEVAVSGGICGEESLPSGERVLAALAAAMEKNGNKLSAAEQEEAAATILTQAIQTMESVRGWSPAKLAANPELSCDAYQFATNMFPELDSRRILDGLTSSTTNEGLFRWLIKASCERQRVLLPKGYRFKRLIPPENASPGSKGFHLLNALDRRLEKQKAVAMTFRPNKFFVNQSDELHAAVIVGREFRDGACKYLVRNSYGPGCGQYRAPYGNAYNCRRGHFWISEDDFQRSAEQIEFLE